VEAVQSALAFMRPVVTVALTSQYSVALTATSASVPQLHPVPPATAPPLFLLFADAQVALGIAKPFPLALMPQNSAAATKTLSAPQKQPEPPTALPGAAAVEGVHTGRQVPSEVLQRLVAAHPLRAPTSPQVEGALRVLRFGAANLAQVLMEACVFAVPPTAALE